MGLYLTYSEGAVKVNTSSQKDFPSFPVLRWFQDYDACNKQVVEALNQEESQQYH